MKAQFSEFSYGFSFVYSLMVRPGHGVAVAPVFPSLIDEGRPDGGWDTKIGRASPLFVQFKRSEYLSRSSAHEWHLFHQPYFRFPFQRPSASSQHAALLALEGAGHSVVYAAPRFWTEEDLNCSFVRRSTPEDSILVSPKSVGSIADDRQHVLAFRASGSSSYLCSEPREVMPLTWNQLQLNLQDSIVSMDEVYLARLREDILHVMDEARSDRDVGGAEDRRLEASTSDERATLFYEISKLSRVLLGAELLYLHAS